MRVPRRMRIKFPRVGLDTHRPTFACASVHHVFTVSLRGHTDLARWVRRLLDADLAVSAAWPSETAVRVPYRYRKQARVMRKVRSSVKMMEQADESNSWRGAFAFARRHPRFGIHYLRGKWLSTKAAPRVAEFAKTTSFTSLAKLFFFHPFVTVWHVLPEVRLTRGNNEQDEVEKPKDLWTPADQCQNPR